MTKTRNLLILEAGGYPAISAIKLLKNCESLYLIAADASPYSAGLYLADMGVVIPPVASSEYKDAIQNIIRECKVDLIPPSFEFGFEQLRDIEGNFITDFSSALLCKDKLLFSQVSRSKGLPVPQTELLEKTSDGTYFPKYIKPRFGTGTRDNFVVRDPEELDLVRKFLKHKGEFIIQDLLVGEHWNVDVLVENGKFLRAVPRRDIERRGGIAVTAEVRDYAELISFSKDVQEELSINSTFNLEIFEVAPGVFSINEINVRFGGGIIFGALAGCDIVSYLVTKDPECLGQLRPGIYSRFYEEVLVADAHIKRYDQLG